MSAFWKTDAFKKLNAKWQKKVAKAGHVEIENTTSPKEELLRWHNHRFKETHLDAFVAKQEYFSKTRSFLHHGAFDSAKHKQLWTLHSEGSTIREIAKSMKLNKNAVCKILLQYRKVMMCK